MKILVKILFGLFSLVFLTYLALPSFDFPDPPPGSLQSNEPADSETPLRRAYFTDLPREEVLKHYQSQLDGCSDKKRAPFFCKFSFLTYRLNYPPEEAFGIIRDQTRSTYLEEVVHPFRESLFVNGFEPKSEKDAIFVNDKFWGEKITVRWVPSTVFARLAVGILTIACIYLIYNGLMKIMR